jgi:hypothetical protein
VSSMTLRRHIALAWQKLHLTRRGLFTSKMDFELRKKLAKCYIRSVALYGAETGMLWAVDQKHSESFKMWCWRRSVGPIM